MAQPIDLLKGAKVESCHLDGDSSVLVFGNLRLVIYNKWAIRDESGMHRDCLGLVGASVRNAMTLDAKFMLDLDAFQVEVDLTPDSWIGPEAAVFYVEGRPAVVWS
jgi:hypothetical protein